VRYALLFDFDGLIVDTETVALRALIEILAEDGHGFELADFGHLLGSVGPDNDRAWVEFLTPRIGTYDSAALDERIWKIARPRIDSLQLMPGVERLVRLARTAGWRTGIATGNSRERVSARLQTLGVFDAFEEIVAFGDVERGKPAPDIYLELARRLDTAPERCVVLEDSVQGCRAAIDAGMTVVLCPCDATRTCEFPDGPSQVATLEELSIDVLRELLTRASVPPRR
jgi:HAD superfamily hydrolase (TIGR01509 family)